MQPYILEDLARERHARLLAEAALARRVPRVSVRHVVGHVLVLLGHRIAGGEQSWLPTRQTSWS